ncbi:hypothetical protein Pmani_000144 [Petrolisthes manimaculis]|uniref:RNA-directed DNA polymerase n=1 Tax=Petrolisthes manimaculis TaxID=1843537 RepID=A0AAE1QN03_9EUCA|nr:hypothetical protein Pmani_000144 [Petrolisthes manimaculis]
MTRSRTAQQSNDDNTVDVDLSQLFPDDCNIDPPVQPSPEDLSNIPIDLDTLKDAQVQDTELAPLFDRAVEVSEIVNFPLCFYVKNGILMHVSVLNFEETTNISVDEQDDILVATDMKLQNSDILANPQVKLQHLTPDQREEMVCLLMEFLQLFGDAPLQCPLVEHDVELVSSARPIKQHPYRVSPWKREALRKEVQFLMDHGLMEKSDSAWASPCLLVDKPDGSFRMCTDYRQVNQLTCQDCYPLPRIDDLIDQLGEANRTWEDHLLQLRALLYNRAEAQLTVNLAKSEFCHAKVVFLGHVVGQGDVSPVSAKVEAIASLPVPQDRKAVMHYLGMTGYYRRFVPNFADVSAPLTDLVSPKKKFVWTQECQDSFVKVRALLTNSPILKRVESDVGVGAVLLQYSDDDVLHPVCYASTKLKPHQKNYSTIEKECYAMIYAIEKFNVYLNGSSFPIDIYTDHKPLKFLHKMKNLNQRIIWALALQPYKINIFHITM